MNKVNWPNEIQVTPRNVTSVWEDSSQLLIDLLQKKFYRVILTHNKERLKAAMLQEDEVGAHLDLTPESGESRESYYYAFGKVEVIYNPTTEAYWVTADTVIPPEKSSKKEAKKRGILHDDSVDLLVNAYGNPGTHRILKDTLKYFKGNAQDLWNILDNTEENVDHKVANLVEDLLRLADVTFVVEKKPKSMFAEDDAKAAGLYWEFITITTNNFERDDYQPEAKEVMRQREIRNLLQKMDYPDPFWILYHNKSGEPQVKWHDSEFDWHNWRDEQTAADLED